VPARPTGLGEWIADQDEELEGGLEFVADADGMAEDGEVPEAIELRDAYESLKS
jgi:hypothetical protein